MKKLLAAIIVPLASVFMAAAQNSITVNVQNLVAVDEQFNVTFIIEGENSPSDFQWSEGPDFQLVWGPQKGTSTSISIINGKRSKTSQTTYTYVLMPKKAGSFQLQPAVATIKGNQVTSRRASIEVVSNGQGGGQGAQPRNGGGTSEASEKAVQTGSVSGSDLYLKLILSRSNVMVGETITATLKLYQRVNIAGFEDARFPTFNGFWSQELQSPSNIEFRRENVGDKIYNTAVLRSWNLVAQQAGDIKIEPAELVCLVNVRAPHASTGSIFDSFFQDDYQTIRKRVATGAYTVHVNSLPAGAPDSFTGGVGIYNMAVALTRDSLKAHEAASLKVTVTGKGNTSLIEAPKLNFPPDFEVYDVKTSDVAGGKVFEYPFIPRSYGEFDIEPVKYTYFDISSRKYVTLESQPVHLKVGKGEDSGYEKTGSLVQGVNRKDVRDLGADIRFISTDLPSLAPVGAFFVGSGLFRVFVILAVVLAAALYFGFRGAVARRADVAGSKNRAATKMARKRLSQAGTYLKGNLYSAFYEELHKALLGFVSDKLNMDAADMSKENISGRLQEKGVPESLTKDFVDMIDACEFARYSPDAGHDAMNAHYERAVGVISAIDENMKRRTRFPGAAASLAVLLMLLPGVSRASDRAYTDSLWTAGVNAYSEGRWSVAAEKWENISALGLESFDLYYNIGNAYFKSGDVARAILYYERSLKVDPSNADARYNLAFARNQVQDKIEEIPEIFIEVIGRRMSRIMPSDAWAVLFILCLAVTLAMVLLFLLGKTSNVRKAGFVTGIVMLVASLLCLDFSLWQKREYQSAESAIVMRAVTSAKSSPGNESSVDLFVLHEGTKVKIIDEVGEWRNIELADGRQGWMKGSDIEVI